MNGKKVEKPAPKHHYFHAFDEEQTRNLSCHTRSSLLLTIITLPHFLSSSSSQGTERLNFTKHGWAFFIQTRLLPLFSSRFSVWIHVYTAYMLANCSLLEFLFIKNTLVQESTTHIQVQMANSKELHIWSVLTCANSLVRFFSLSPFHL